MRSIAHFGLALLIAGVTYGQTQREREDRQRSDQNPNMEQDRRADRDTATTGSIRCFRCKKLIGSDVKNSQGKNLGEIEDLAIASSDGRVAYAVLSFGGFLGMGDKFFAIPFRALKPQTDGTYVFDVEKSQLEGAEGFDKNNWPNMADPRWAEKTHRQFGQTYPDIERKQGTQPDRADERDHGQHGQEAERGHAEHGQTERGQTERTEPTRMVRGQEILRASQVISATVKNSPGEKLGEVEDLIVDTNHGQINCAVLSFGGLSGVGDKLFAIPWTKLNVVPKQDDRTKPTDVDHVMLTIDEQTLKNAPSFTNRDWPRENDPAYFVTVYRFYSVPVYWE